jgi:surface protein
MNNMFISCPNLESLDLSGWNTSNVTGITAMFNGCTNLTTIYVGSGWNTENVTYSDGTFVGCTSLVGGMGTEYDPEHVNGDYAHIDGGEDNPGYFTAIPLDPVEYIDADGQTAYCQYYTILNGSTDYSSYGEDGVEAWYVVDHDVTYTDDVSFNGSANLILVDGATLTLNPGNSGPGITMSTSNNFNIYVQSAGNGAITATDANIGADDNLTIYGGHISLTSVAFDACYLFSSDDLTINGGQISIVSNEKCIRTYNGLLTINGGTLNAVTTEENNSFGYSIVDCGYDGDVFINGGNITLTNDGDGHGISASDVTINGGNVSIHVKNSSSRYGINVGGTITLGWTDASDRIMSQGGYNTYQLNIATGQAFTDGEGNYYFGTYYLYEMPDLAGKTLVPFTNLSETFNITYVTNGGTLPDGYPTTYTFGETVVLPIPTKEDNAFAGWFDNAEFDGYPVTEIVAGTALGNKTFYAKWMPAKTWVEYLDADGQQQRVYATALYGIETELPGGVYTIVDDGVSFDKLSFTGTTTIILPDNKYLYVECMGKGTNDDEYSLFVNGDLTIYGQEHGDGVFGSYNVQVSGDVAIYGGYHDIGQLSANNGSGTITLSWTGWDSSIRVGVYLGKVVLAKAFMDGDYTIYEAGPVEDVTTINDKMLYPCVTETEVSYLDANGVLQTTTAKVLYGGTEAEYPGGVYTVMADYAKSDAYYDRLHFTGDATIIIPDYGRLGNPTYYSDDHWLKVDGDLTIYGQTYGKGECLFKNATILGDVNAYGGRNSLLNVNADNINLSWTAVNNGYYIVPQAGTLNLLKDFVTETSDGLVVIPAGNNIPYEVISDKVIYPYAETVAVSYIDENGDTHTENATVLWGNETSLSGGTYTFVRDISFSQAVSFSGDTKLIVPDGTYFYGYYQGGGINLNVNGDLAIYGQENRSGTVLYINASVSGAVTVSNVRVIYSFINSESDILIAGGEHEYGQLSANGTITLGYLTFNDRIYCNDYEGTVAIREGQTMINDWNQMTYSGTLTAEQITEIEGQYLRPYLTPITFDVAGYGESTESDHWVFIASPIAGNISTDYVSNLIGGTTTSGQYDYDLYRFNQSAELEWENYQQHNTMNNPFLLENGKGYLYANKNDVTLEFSGAVYPAASKEVALDYDANSPHADTRGWNLVGNPFNAPATLNKSYYKMNSTGTGLLAEAVSTNTSIDAFTGVMVQAENENDIITFVKTDQKSTLPEGPQGGFEIALTQAGNRGNALLDNAIVSFNEGDQLGKFYFGTQDANIYIPQNNKEYAIAYVGNQNEVPVNFKAHENGEYTLTVSVTPHSSLLTPHLIDNLTGADIDLLVTPSYTFTARTDDYASRFKLVFTEGDADEDDDFAFIDADGNIIINGIDGHATIQLIDQLGHILISKQLSTLHSPLSTSNFPTGVYVLRLINGEKVKTQKIVIR